MKDQVQTVQNTKNGISAKSKKAKAVKVDADELKDLDLGEDDAEFLAHVAKQNAEAEMETDDSEDEVMNDMKPMIQVNAPKAVPIVRGGPKKPAGNTDRFIDTSDFDAQFEDDLKKVATSPKEFMDLIATAKANGADGIEATAKVIAYYNKGVVPEAGFFIFHNVKVYEEGKKKEINKRLNATLY